MSPFPAIRGRRQRRLSGAVIIPESAPKVLARPFVHRPRVAGCLVKPCCSPATEGSTHCSSGGRHSLTGPVSHGTGLSQSSHDRSTDKAGRVARDVTPRQFTVTFGPSDRVGHCDSQRRCGSSSRGRRWISTRLTLLSSSETGSPVVSCLSRVTSPTARPLVDRVQPDVDITPHVATASCRHGR